MTFFVVISTRASRRIEQQLLIFSHVNIFRRENLLLLLLRAIINPDS
jgi:hypothetical protein